jgi:DNA-binding XRE family transcriptional regulator
VEQKVALVKKIELYRLEKALSYNKLGKQLGTQGISLRNWEKNKNLPTSQFCYQIELLTANWEPTLYKDRLNVDFIQTYVSEYKSRKAKELHERKQKTENSV